MVASSRPEKDHKEHRLHKVGASAKKGKKNKKGSGEKREPKPQAFGFRSSVKAKRLQSRDSEKEQRRLHVPSINRSTGEPAPFIVVVHGPPKVGKSVLIKSLVKHYTKQNLSEVRGPVTVISGKQRRVQFVECPNDISGMIDAAKCADLAMLLIDGSYGFEMETFEFLNILQVHGFPSVMGVLTHIDKFKDVKKLRKTKQRLKHRFCTEIRHGAKLFYLSGLIHGKYPKREIHNLARFVSVMKDHPLSWRSAHPYILVDRFEDVTPPEKVHANKKCDRNITLYGYLRGCNMKQGSKVHIAGAGDFSLAGITSLPDPCPLPSAAKKKGLRDKEKLFYAPMSGLGDLLYDKDAVYIEINDHLVQFSNVDNENEAVRRKGKDVGEDLVKTLQKTRCPIDEKLEQSSINLFSRKSLPSENIDDANGPLSFADPEDVSGKDEAGETILTDESEQDDSDDENDYALEKQHEDNGALNPFTYNLKEETEYHGGRLRRKAISDIDYTDLKDFEGEDSDNGLDDELELSGESGDDCDSDVEISSTAKWKESLVARTQSRRNSNLMQLVYGEAPSKSGGIQDARSSSDDESDDDEAFFKPKNTSDKENKEGLGLLKTAIAKAGYTGKLSNAHYPVTHSDVAQIHDSTDELLPKTLVVTLGQGSTVTSMEFHPSRATLLLVGTNNGDIAFWDIASQERLDYKNFEVWDRSSCSSLLQESLTKDPAILVKRVAWSHDGSQIGVAYSKHLVHLYTYNRREHLIQYLEIEAHVGGVNDLVFPEPNGLVVVITCGDDKLIKIWDTTSGFVLFTFEGHETPVYSICPQSRENTKFIFSTSFDGKIKAWLYDHSEPKVDFTAPGNSCTRLGYTDDGKRLFSCGTSKDGDTHIVEWNESEGTLKRRYKGLQKPSTGVVQFDMTKNRFLAAGDDFLIKFWDMDSAALLTTTDAEGGLQASPHVRFNKSGSLLAVSTKENSIKVLASVDGLKLLRSCENRSSDAVRLVSEAMTKVPTIRPSSSVSAMAATGAAMANRDDLVPSVAELQNGDTPSMEDVKPRIINEPIEKSKPSKLPEINESSQCSLMMLPDDFSSAKATKIAYSVDKEFRHLVTLDSALFEKPGTMSGGGGWPRGGRMGTCIKENVSVQAVADAYEEHANLEEQMKSLRQKISDAIEHANLEEQMKSLRQKISDAMRRWLRQKISDAMRRYQASEKVEAHLEMELAKCQKEIDSMNAQHNYLEKQLDSLKNDELSKLKELDSTISSEQKELDRLTKCPSKLRQKDTEIKWHKIKMATGQRMLERLTRGIEESKKEKEKLAAEKERITSAFNNVRQETLTVQEEYMKIEELIDAPNDVVDKTKADKLKKNIDELGIEQNYVEYKLHYLKQFTRKWEHLTWKWEKKVHALKRRLDDLLLDVLLVHAYQGMMDRLQSAKLELDRGN